MYARTHTHTHMISRVLFIAFIRVSITCTIYIIKRVTVGGGDRRSAARTGVTERVARDSGSQVAYGSRLSTRQMIYHGDGDKQSIQS